MGILGAYFGSSFSDLAVYFVSLTGFVATYIWGESVRKSGSKSIWKFGKCSTRQLMIYITILLWAILGSVGIIKSVDLRQLSAYFAALTPFVSSFILGKSYFSHK